MLSTETPPPDPDKACDGNHPKLELVDLCKSDNKFSIRDYVLNNRSKDIKDHWPFSRKNLQLCLKYGIKDVLPPFQSRDSVRNQSIATNESGEENSAQIITRSPYLEAKAEKSQFQPPPGFDEVESDSSNAAKKSKLIVKLSNIVGPRFNQESSANTSESMASKVCPVCKTFSSPSNTTLNAHIDQCLSGESTVKWTGSSKVVKHRIKQRKTRSMVDIYETAKCCTLEDLDRRNGTNWALHSSSPAEDMKLWNDHNNSLSSPVHGEDNNNKGAVYFDSNGTKLRILSKFSGLQPNFGKDDCVLRKLNSTDIGGKLLSNKKNKPLVNECKILKCPNDAERSCSSKSGLYPKVRKFIAGADKKEMLLLRRKAHDPMKSDGFEIRKPWLESKRGLQTSMISREHDHQHTDKTTTKNLRTSHIPPREQACLRKRERFPSLESRRCIGKKSLPACDAEELEGDVSPRKKRCADPSNDANDNTSSQCNKRNREANLDNSRMNHRNTVPSQGKRYRSPKQDPAILFGDKKSSLSTWRRASPSESKKRLKLQQVSGSGIDRNDSQVKVPGNYTARSEKASRKLLDNENGRQFVNSSDEDSDAEPTSSEDSGASASPQSDSVAMKTVDSSAGCKVPAGTSYASDAVKEIDIQDKYACGEAFMTFSGLDVEMDSQTRIKAYDEQENICADKTASCNDAEINPSEGAQGNYFVDVDAIAIPGPPGCFLPSPGRTDSEEIRGSSSLTISRIPSSDDEQENDMMDIDLTNSPISATSLAPNSVIGRSDSASVAKSHGTQCAEERTNHIAESSSGLSEQVTGEEGKSNTDITPSGSSNFQQPELQNSTSFPPLPLQISCNELRTFQSISDKHPGMEPAPKVIEKSPNSVLVSHNAETKFPAYRDYESPSPSTSSSVLRLMGKNLMVVNKEENPSSELQTGRSCLQPNAGNKQNEHHYIPSRGGEQFKGFDSSRIAELPSHPLRVILSSNNFGTSSIHNHDWYVANKVGTPIPQQNACDSWKGEDSSAMESKAPAYYYSREVNPFYSYQMQWFPQYGGSRNENMTPQSMSGGSRVAHRSPSMRSSLHFAPVPKNFT